MGKPLIIWRNWFYCWIWRPMFPIRCPTVVKLRLQQMGDFYEKPHLQWKILNFERLKGGGWKFLHQTTKRHTLTPNLVEQIVWRMWQWRCFDTIQRREKKVRENRHWKIDVIYNTTPLPRRRDKICLNQSAETTAKTKCHLGSQG